MPRNQCAPLECWHPGMCGALRLLCRQIQRSGAAHRWRRPRGCAARSGIESARSARRRRPPGGARQPLEDLVHLGDDLPQHALRPMTHHIITYHCQGYAHATCNAQGMPCSALLSPTATLGGQS